MITAVNQDFLELHKFTMPQVRAKLYRVQPSDCYPITAGGLHRDDGPVGGMDSPIGSDLESDEAVHLPAPQCKPPIVEYHPLPPPEIIQPPQTPPSPADQWRLDTMILPIQLFLLFIALVTWNVLYYCMKDGEKE